MHKRNSRASLDVVQLFIDILLILTAYAAANQIYAFITKSYVEPSYLWALVVFGVIFLLFMSARDMYDFTTFYYVDRIFRRTLISTTFSLLCITPPILLANYDFASKLFFILFVVFAFVLNVSCRVFIRFARKSNMGGGYTRILFIGSQEMYDRYNEYVKKTSYKIEVVSRLDFDAPELQTEEEMEELLVKLSVNELTFVKCFDVPTPIKVNSILQICEDMGITTHLLLDTYELPESEKFISSIGTVPVLTYHSVSLDRVQLFWKAIMDISGALFGLIVFSPVFLFTALAIKIESPGPVVFAQERVGKNGKRFKIYKFRSMYKDAEARKAELQAKNKMSGGLMFKIDDDPRITRVGKFIRKTSIDELPQLINVVKRDMSLVGTRPPTVDEVEKYERHHHRRISIMPGITGMWQVSGRSEITDFEEVVKLDKKYIEQWSIGLDIKLIIKTVTSVLGRRGAV